MEPTGGWTERPSKLKSAAVAVRTSPWYRKRHPKTGRFLYFNIVDKKTTWTEPTEGWTEFPAKVTTAANAPQASTTPVETNGPIADLTTPWGAPARVS